MPPPRKITFLPLISSIGKPVAHRPAHADHVARVHLVQGVGDGADLGDGEIHRLVDAGDRGDAERRLTNAEGRKKAELARLVGELAGHLSVLELNLEQLDAGAQRLDVSPAAQIWQIGLIMLNLVNLRWSLPATSLPRSVAGPR